MLLSNVLAALHQGGCSAQALSNVLAPVVPVLAGTKYPNFLPPLHPRGPSVSPVIIRIVASIIILFIINIIIMVMKTTGTLMVGRDNPG